MISADRTKPRHLAAALPAAALVGGLSMSFGLSLGQPVSALIGDVVESFALLPLQAALVGLYLLPLTLVAGIPSYFVLRRFNKLTYPRCASIGGVVGLIVGTLDPAWRGMFTIVCAVVGVCSASAAYYVLYRLSRDNGTVERAARRSEA